jgi:hypothetical protein
MRALLPVGPGGSGAGGVQAELAKIRESLARMRAEVDEHRRDADRYDVEAGVYDGDVIILQMQLRNVIECIKIGKAAVGAVLCLG